MDILAQLKQRLNINNNNRDESLKLLIDGVFAAIEAFLGKKIAAEDYTERYNGNGKDRLVLNQYPVLTVYSIKANGREIDGWDFDNWLLIRKSRFPEGVRNIEVRYRAGFETMPADIVEAALLIAVQRVNEMENKGIQSKSLAGETITFSNFSQTGGMPPAAFAILQQYRRKGV